MGPTNYTATKSELLIKLKKSSPSSCPFPSEGNRALKKCTYDKNRTALCRVVTKVGRG